MIKEDRPERENSHPERTDAIQREDPCDQTWKKNLSATIPHGNDQTRPKPKACGRKGKIGPDSQAAIMADHGGADRALSIALRL